ncbi:MAG: metallophosphoesterase [Solobacterium sp.]|nr:metallophosphoesterase [Solobacterium sp.]
MNETFYRIRMDQLQVTERPVIALVADIHNNPPARVIASLEKYRPDLIAICGDLIYGVESNPGFLKMEESENAMELLNSCVRIAPTYFSLGNHEYVLTRQDMELIRNTGTVILDNTWAEFRPGIFIGGLSSARMKGKSKIPDHQWLDEFEKLPGYRILMSHHPEYWALQEPYLKERKIDLVLSGHAHGGQIRFRRKGRWQGLYCHNQGLFPEYTSDIHKGPYGYLVISRGLANTSQPLPRLFNAPELVYIVPEGRNIGL